jgi:hypothetical protein
MRTFFKRFSMIFILYSCLGIENEKTSLDSFFNENEELHHTILKEWPDLNFTFIVSDQRLVFPLQDFSDSITAKFGDKFYDSCRIDFLKEVSSLYHGYGQNDTKYLDSVLWSMSNNGDLDLNVYDTKDQYDFVIFMSNRLEQYVQAIIFPISSNDCGEHGNLSYACYYRSMDTSLKISFLLDENDNVSSFEIHSIES